jgi:four helix bundle protein
VHELCDEQSLCSLGIVELAGVLGHVKAAAAAGAAVLRGLKAARSLDASSARLRGGDALASNAGRKDNLMLRIYDTILEFIRRIAPIIEEIERYDRDLGRQLRRSVPSMALNTCEGSAGRAGTRMQRYRDALGSARETGASLDVAVAFRYIRRIDAETLDMLDTIRATLAKNVK